MLEPTWAEVAAHRPALAARQSYQQVVDQVGGFLRDLVADWDRRMVNGHSATRWALDCLLDGKALEELVDAPFEWQEGWRYLDRPRPHLRPRRARCRHVS